MVLVVIQVHVTFFRFYLFIFKVPKLSATMSSIPPLGPQSVHCICPTCKASIQTSVDEISSNSAYLCCMLMCIIGCGLCSCIPFCMDNFKVYKHSCPSCKTFIGTYQQQ